MCPEYERTTAEKFVDALLLVHRVSPRDDTIARIKHYEKAAPGAVRAALEKLGFSHQPAALAA